MATATQPLTPRITMEEYMHTVYEPECEFVDGYLEERHVGEPKHGLLQMQVGIWFSLHPEWNLRAISKLRTRVSSTKIRVPDVAIVVNDDLLLQYPRSTPAFIAVEILSPEDRIPRVIRRLKNFLEMGTAHVWLIDPEERIAYVYTKQGLNLVEGNRIEVAGSPVFLELVQFFAALPPLPMRLL